MLSGGCHFLLPFFFSGKEAPAKKLLKNDRFLLFLKNLSLVKFVNDFGMPTMLLVVSHLFRTASIDATLKNALCACPSVGSGVQLSRMARLQALLQTLCKVKILKDGA